MDVDRKGWPTDRSCCWREKMRKGVEWNKEMVPLLLLRVYSSALEPSAICCPASTHISHPAPSFLPPFPHPPWRYVTPRHPPPFLPARKADSTTTTGNPRLLKRPRRRVCILLHAGSCMLLTPVFRLIDQVVQAFYTGSGETVGVSSSTSPIFLYIAFRHS